MPRTVIADIRNHQFPDLTVEVGTWVVWRNLDPRVHSAETLRTFESYFSAGPLLPGETSSPVRFEVVGHFPYVCRYHHDMNGVVNVVPRGSTSPAPSHGSGHNHGGHQPHLRHLHGFVTGGRPGKRFYMTHTPVLADARQQYQVILQGSLPDDKHSEAYSALRASAYVDGKVQIFHEHIALPDIGAGQVSELPKSSFEYYPDDPEGVLKQEGGTSPQPTGEHDGDPIGV